MENLLFPQLSARYRNIQKKIDDFPNNIDVHKSTQSAQKLPR